MTQLDNEVVKTIKDAHKKATEMLSENMEALHKISEFLIEKETITGEQFMKILKEIQNKPEEAEETVAEESSQQETEEAPKTEE